MNDNKKKRGFASMSPEERKRIATLGGKRVQQLGTAHRWTREEASIAGKKGGNAPKQVALPAEVVAQEPDADEGST